MLKGILYAKNGKFDEAKTEYYKILEIKTSQEIVESAQSLIEVIDYANKERIKKDALIYFFKAIECENKEDYSGAISEYEKSIKIDPGIFYSYHNLSGIYSEKNMLDEAVLECKKSIEINPNYALSHHRLGALYIDKKVGMKPYWKSRKPLKLIRMISMHIII